MPKASCIFEIYKVTCDCGEEYTVMVRPQEIEIRTTAKERELRVRSMECPKCKAKSEFLGDVCILATLPGGARW